MIAIWLFLFSLGFLFFVVSPILGRLGLKKWSGLHLWLAQFVSGRSALVLGEHGDLYFKSMSFSDLGVEEIGIGDETKEFEDPDDALHYWINVPFALADEVHGILFDPRHAAIGAKKQQSEEQGEMHAKATDEEWRDYRVSGWVKGVFELPKRQELVTLESVRSLVAGSERAEHPGRVTEYYKNSRKPKADNGSTLRLLIPVVAFLAILGGMWLIRDQMGGGGGGGSTLPYGGSMLLMSTLGVDRDKVKGYAVAAGKWLAMAMVPLLAVVGLVVTLGPVTGLIGIGAFVLGFAFLPLLAIITQASDALSGMFSSLGMRLGMLGYDRPVFVWTPDSYRLREYNQLDDVGRTVWYGLKGSLVGFTFPATPDAFPEGLTAEELEDNAEMVTDGSGETNIPSGYVPSKELDRGPYGGFVPENTDPDSFYIESGLAMSRLAAGARGSKMLTKLEWAKEEYGLGGWDVSDKTIAKYTFLAVLVAGTLGTVIFFGDILGALFGGLI